ncbi:LysE family transporter [Streptomyces sp. NPDC050564]|uniref:LysE family transporter n=1 Tax=Streptomyces sp. NPDC050564 TaxID=3365631 RepID=UPI0037AC8C14
MAAPVTAGADAATLVAAGARTPPVAAEAHTTAPVVARAHTTALVAAGAHTAAVATEADAPVATGAHTAALVMAAGAHTAAPVAARAHTTAPPESAEPSVPSPARAFLRGAAISGLNPKGLLLYLSVLPQFLKPGAGAPVAAQTAVLGAVHMACCAAVYLGVGVLARAVLGARPAAARAVVRTSGAAMLGIGGFLLVERLATL